MGPLTVISCQHELDGCPSSWMPCNAVTPTPQHFDSMCQPADPHYRPILFPPCLS